MAFTITATTILVFLLTAAVVQSADPDCSKGLSKSTACCPAECGTCGGSGCYQRSLSLNTRCCPSGILNPSNSIPSCNDSDAPCIITEPPMEAPTDSPTEPTMEPPASLADPKCETGVAAGGACCIAGCERCGGINCGMRSRSVGSRCCIGGILNPVNNLPSCDESLPPCILNKGDTTPPPPTPTASPSPVAESFSSLDGTWMTAAVEGTRNVVARHEACALMVNGKVVLIGGRGTKPVSLYDPNLKTWATKSRFNTTLQIHHFQCVSYESSVWIVASWNLGFPNEGNNAVVFEYNVDTDIWKTYDGLPEPRRRGGAASVIIGETIYVIAGNRGGHGAQAKSLPWVDSFNVVTKNWTMNALPDMPDAGRDHTGAAVLGNGEICVAGGRDGGSAGFFRLNIASTYCYSFERSAWEQRMDFPSPRAGAMTGTTCEGYMMIAGGEGDGMAYKRVDVFDGENWISAPDLVQARHGSGLAFAECSECGHIFIPSGSGRQGGRPELLTTEQYIPDGAPMECANY